MKKIILLFTAVFFIFALSGCKEDSSREAEEAELDAVSSTLTGTLKKYTGEKLTVKTEDGETLSFKDCSKAQIECENGIIPGNQVTLVYVGGIEGSDTSNVRVRKIITTDDNSNVMSLAKKAREEINSLGGSVANNNSQAGQEPPASGAAVESANESATIVSAVNVRSDAQSGSEVLGVLDGGESVLVTGICENGWYRIAYQGQTGYVWRDYISM